MLLGGERVTQENLSRSGRRRKGSVEKKIHHYFLKGGEQLTSPGNLTLRKGRGEKKR